MTTKYEPNYDREPDDPDLDQYAAFPDDEGVVIYDTENDAAWLSSDASVELATMT